MSNKKRKQHYVWEHYLLAWATQEQVWCRRELRRFRTNTDNLAHKRDFYRLREMSDADLAFVEALLLNRFDPETRALTHGWIEPFTKLFLVRKQYEQEGTNAPEFEQQLDVAINNLEEDIHSKIEGRAVEILANLRDEHAAFVEDPEKLVHFMRFIAAQYMRTPSIKNGALEALREAPGVNVDATWGLIRTILSTSLAYGLFRRRGDMRLTFLRATNGNEFITGDQPIINIRAQESAESSELELYYPLTPSVALLIDFGGANPSTEHRELDPSEISAFNGLIEAASHEQIYAASEDALIALG